MHAAPHPSGSDTTGVTIRSTGYPKINENSVMVNKIKSKLKSQSTLQINNKNWLAILLA